MRFDDEFKDKVIIVTGSAGGLGKETAVKYAEAGAKVVIADLKEDLGKRTAEEINEKFTGKALFSRLDVTVQSSVDEMVQDAINAFGTVDILVNSAGISGKGSRPFHKIELKEWDITYAVNVKGIISCCKAVTEVFQSKQSGKIVNVSSIAGRMPAPGLIHYGASKAAVINLTQTLAVEMARFNVNVNAVCPGWIWTPIYSENEDFKALAQKMGKTPRDLFLDVVNRYCPLRREQTEEDIANTILFLSSESAKNITGQSINVDGGAVMR
jgi:NAD(P)-dependent dehydrogenase (short-subunit alcohol dehydrogenase family)